MLITVDNDSEVTNHGSVWVVSGTDSEGDRVTFAGDARVVCSLLDAVTALGEVSAYIEDWQIIG